MGYALPSGIVNSGSLFLFIPAAPVPLGPYIKQVGDQTLVVLDYQQASVGTGLTNYSFDVDVSTNPQLVISFPKLNEQAPKYTLSFLLSGGIPEQQYNIAITAHYSLSGTATQRVDQLVINIPSSGKAIQPVASVYSQLPLWGGGYVNSAVRAFWGEVPPVNPNVMDQWFSTTDGKLYEWMTDGATAQWVIIFADDYLTDAPNDGVLYGRKDTLWSPVPISEILFDAPSDGSYYARQNHDWAAVPRIPQPSDIPPLMDAPVPVPGVSVDFARIDHVHPTDLTLYSASNPAGYQTAAQVTTTLGAYMPLTGGVFSGTVSFQTAALFASPTNIQVGGGNPNYVLSTNGAGALSWVPPTVGISDAPVDTQTYARNHGAWVNITTATGVPEAPNDGQLWARENLTWVVVPIGGGAGIADAPNDSTTYARRNTSGAGAWQHITHTDITDWSATLAPYALQTNLPQPSGITPVMNGTGAIGTSLTYARADHAHPSDTSRYAASNPANYIPDAPNDGTVYARKAAPAGWTHLTHNDITDWVASAVPVTVSGTAPITPQTGALWWNTADQQLYVWSGTAWVVTVSPPTISEAPNDGTTYARKNSAWAHLTHNDITDWAASLGAYLLKSGGTMTGPLNGTSFGFSGGGSLTSTLNIRGTGGGAGAYVGFYDGPAARNGYFGQFGSSGLIWQYESPTISINLNSNGSIYLNGPVQAGAINASGVIHSNADITANGNMSCGTMFSQLSTGGTVTAGALHSTGNSQIDGSEQVNGNFNCSNTVAGYTGNFSYSTIYGNIQINNNLTANNTIRSVGSRIISQGNNSNPSLCSYNTVGYASAFWCDANGTIGMGDADGNGVPQNYRFTLDRSSNVGAINSISCAGNVVAHGAVYCDNVGGGFFQRDSAGNFYTQLYCGGDNVAHWINNRLGSQLYLDPNPFFVAAGISAAFKPGGGVWAALSDKRIKDVLGGYKGGLKEILQLEPVEFVYKGNDAAEKDGESLHAVQAKNKTKMIGYVADDIMKVLPETVSLQKGFIDGKEVNDLKSLDQTNIIHALVNAVKELHAEVQALKAAHA